MAAKSKEGMTPVRVLCAVDIDGVRHEPDAVIDLNESDLYIYRKSVDSDPAAVEYAQKQHERAARRQRLNAELDRL